MRKKIAQLLNEAALEMHKSGTTQDYSLLSVVAEIADYYEGMETESEVKVQLQHTLDTWDEQ